ncbi:oxidoreductase domain protein [Isosphaera pallida ATCC 43644]|uniref:Oxidoreductase domain protein n=1 Tax=Isosphaera pallida (strain ATCC 43644 / DSM 9630 / IS1B) TaxID=575540 RepID=E8R589_ISOPI|nr:Gfo/Idh/MocA family oxidoreductase [Isosphaera pallida]ADV63842.1 oxidoreductase domain protein [Isosphaera pallida ATCC 43644]
MNSSPNVSRRVFLGTAAATAALPATSRGAVLRNGPNDQIRLALIGAGSRGNQLLDSFFNFPEARFVAVTDPDDRQAERTANRIKEKNGGKTPQVVRDYRCIIESKEIDGVVIATPDHWHALPTIHACMNGKDVYVEKPVAHNVVEGRAMVKAARKYDRVVAVGTQQRSSNHFQKAVEIVRSGKLGKIFWVQTWNFENISPTGMGPAEDTDPPPYVDWDLWLGPAPKVPFNINRFHLLFRWFFDYAGGMMSDWGVHLNDIVLWALDQKAPRTVSARGGIFTLEDNRDTPDTLQVVYEFPECVLTYSMRKGNGLKFNGKSYGILFCGTDGSLMLDRDGFEIIPDQTILPYGIQLTKGNRETRKINLKAEKMPGDDGQTPHVKNFLDCMRDRKRPICDIEIAHWSTNTCHLGNIAYKVGRTLEWDFESETFVNDKEANALLFREPRQGFELPKLD